MYPTKCLFIWYVLPQSLIDIPHFPRNPAALEMLPHISANLSKKKNATLEISPHGKGLTKMYVCTHALYVCIQMASLLKLHMHVQLDLCKHHPQNLAVLK